MQLRRDVGWGSTEMESDHHWPCLGKCCAKDFSMIAVGSPATVDPAAFRACDLERCSRASLRMSRGRGEKSLPRR